MPPGCCCSWRSSGCWGRWVGVDAGANLDAASSPPISDYALIGDCRSAALVAKDGSLDWLCWPRFDSPSLFAALLDAERGGRFRIRPVGAFRSERRYLPDSNVLETIFHMPHGAVALRDLMPVAAEAEKRAVLVSEHEILREVEGLHGEVAIEILYAPRPDYGAIHPTLQQHGPFGLQCEIPGAALTLLSDRPLALARDGHSADAVTIIAGGDRIHFSLTYTAQAPAVAPPLRIHARERITRSEQWWRDWAARCTYQGPYRDAVVRSALVLKLMAYAPSGAIVAAPTTSLPEKLGGVRNWDYRYCWLRDAAFTLRALFDLGYGEEGAAFLGWMLHATRLTWPELQVLYDVYGEAHLPERHLPHLDGYAGSRPVRVGNDAHGQLQLDVYGEVIDAAARFARTGGRFDRDTVKMLAGLGRTVCARWHEADAGIWEGRAGRFQHTHAKVLCWVALDRLIALHRGHRLPIDVALYRRVRDSIRETIERRGYNERLGSYTRLLDGDDLDASLLTLPLYGYIDAAHPRMVATCARIHQRLGRDGLLYRYNDRTADGLPAGEGAFGICSFWAVECRALGGDLAGAMEAFERLLAYANDVGLLAEEIDPVTGAALGNFPQAFTHVGLINAALTLVACGREQGTEAHCVPLPTGTEGSG
jgi:GH15 family glucan-1,4-alpha-glucosidase